jgi:quercetin dioxygenase-like cupin family protein
MSTTNDDPTTQEWQAAMMRSAGPLTDPTKMTFFDIDAMDWTGVVTGREPPEDLGNPMTSLKALVNPGGNEGCSLQAVKYRPHAVVPRHRHDVPQVVLVLEGEARLGSRVLKPGAGYHTPAGFGYSVQAGAEGLTVLEFRPSPLNFRSDYDKAKPEHLGG